jgi:DNA-binding CsgD family transcriptional regulator
MDVPLIGRQPEQDLLHRQWQHALVGQPGVVILSGEAGIGKTRLLAEFAGRAESEGSLVLHGDTFEMEGMPPFLPFLDALGPYIRTAPLEELTKQIGIHAPVLATLFLDIPQRLGSLETNYALPSELARFRLFEAMVGFFSNLCQSRPVLLLLDDLQWADAASLDLLVYLVRRRGQMRLLILGAMRSSGKALHLLAELERLHCLTLIELPPLSADVLAQLARRQLGAPLGVEAMKILHDRSEGNPFFAEELLHNWLETGRLAHAQTGWWLSLKTTEKEFPESIRRAIEGRLTRLPVHTVERLRPAAILGRQFESELLAEILGEETETVEGHLLPAVEAGLIRPWQRGFAFGHDLIREALYQQVPITRAQRLHGVIGRAFEARQRTQTAQQLSNLAFHFTRSGDRRRGIRYAQSAAESALRAYAPKEAMGHYQSALDLLTEMEQEGLTPPARRGDLLLGFGETALQSGLEQEAGRAFAAGLEWFRRNGDADAAALAAHGLGRAHWQVEEIAAAEEAFRLALELLDEQIHGEAARLHTDLANLLVLSRHQYEEGVKYARRSLIIAYQLEDASLTAAALRTLGNLHVRANSLPEGIAHLEQALTLAMQANDLVEAAETCTGLIIALIWNCNFERIPAIASRLIDLAERCQARYYTRHVYSLIFFQKAAQGDIAGSQIWLERAEETVVSFASPEPLAFLHFIKAIVAYITGNHKEMAAQAMETVEILRASDPEALIWYLGTGALANLICGRHAAARAQRDELEIRLRALAPDSFPSAEALNDLALYSLAAGEHDRLLDLYSKLLPFRGHYHNSLIDWVLGYIEIIRGDWEAAESSLKAADALARRENLRWELAQTLVARAELELARGGSGSAMRARTSLAEALEVFKAYGNKPQVQRIRTRMRDLPRQPGEKPEQPTPAGLSRRELDVLRLLAQGRSNREIAEALALSEKTIANHVTNILNKIGMDNRAAAAAFAVRQRLA